MIRKISAKDCKALLHGQKEISFLDLREAGPYSEGHPLFATNCPFSVLEARVGTLVPRSSVLVVLIDGGDGISALAARLLSDMGYGDIAVVSGGTREWAAAGYTLYQGVNVPSKTLGELVEHLWHPNLLDAKTLARWCAEGRSFEFYDCRPAQEYAKMTVPGAVCLPNGELAHRLPVLDGTGPLVLTCAGRTRGVIGAASLARIDPQREIYALENGTQGWRLAGFELAFDNVPAPLADLDGTAAEATRRRALDFMSREKIQNVDVRSISRMLSEPDRTTFLIDVRSEEEATLDPLTAFAHALSGQLVQATDQWIGVRRARVVLADDLGLRAALSAFWLRAMGFEVYVTEVNDGLRLLPEIVKPMCPNVRIERCTPESALDACQNGQGVFLDARTSDNFSKEHVRSAVWVIRPNLSRLNINERYFLIGDDSPRANLVARELERLGHRDFAIVKGGHTALKKVGAPMVSTLPIALSQAIDVTSFAHGRHEGDLNASRLYLDWEMGLVNQLDGDDRAEFKL